MISVEKVLNSRCSCGFDSSSKNSHWGVFSEQKHPSHEDLRTVLEYCSVPQFSDGRLLQRFQDKYILLSVEKKDDPFKMRLLHVESGMQQEAVYLACTAMGLGTCIDNVGINGTEHKDSIATAKHLILEKKDTYRTGKFSTVSPGPEKLFIKGKNLNEPSRDGEVECLDQMQKLTLSNNGRLARRTDISQLLWAARGRTPHYIKHHPWGLTIPTWGGGQNYTKIHFVEAKRLFRYVNWTTSRYIDIKTRFFPWWILGNPTHDLKYIRNADIPFESHAASFIILSRNEPTHRALWEIGYMLENMLLQAKSLEISYESRVFKEDEIRKLRQCGISEAVAALVL